MRVVALVLFVLLPGVAAVLVCGYFLSLDWNALQSAYSRFEIESRSGGDLRALHAASASDLIYRVNCLGDGLGVMLGAVIASIGIHGLCVLPPRPKNVE
jgi:hypothetical protein